MKKSRAKQRETAAAADADQSQPPLHCEESPRSETPIEPTDETVADEPHAQKKGWELWKPRATLAAAILLPCLLETLDYTGSFHFILI